MGSHSRRTVLQRIAAAAVLPCAARAQAEYPNGMTIKVIVAYPPGGTSDVVGRAVAEHLAALWAVPVVVENVAGANGNIGIERVVKGPSNGNQLLVMTANVATNPFLYPNLPFDPVRDLVPVSCVARLPNIVVVRKDLPVASMADLIAHAKANPGKLNYGSPGTGSSPHLAAEMFKRFAGIDMMGITYKGSGPALHDLIAGNIDVMIDNITAAIALVHDGRIKGLAVTGARPSPHAPDLPTVAQTLPGYEVNTFHGIGVRAGTAATIVARIESDVRALASNTRVRERLASLGAEVVGSSSKEFGEMLASERAQWGRVIRELGIRLE
jgi:tripartite-type tricarboxylate transporter receptor subunit TctC